ncbi:MAG: RHS repeat-associated core domain-containing protein [Pyrinomonadaceae bacterium]
MGKSNQQRPFLHQTASCPDAHGSTHEFRASDIPVNCGSINGGCVEDLTGTFLSVDGSRMRLESGSSTSTLYLPDGSRYVFGGMTSGPAGNPAHTFYDRHGNKMTFNTTTRVWTDTMGRAIGDPIAFNWNGTQNQEVGDDVVKHFPGFGTSDYDVKFSWHYLQDPNGEDALENPSDTLRSLSDKYCQGNYEHTVTGLYLFGNGDYFTRICGLGFDTQGPPFNPIVLTKIELPNGQSYQFKYNVYGEITKVTYPTGAYERFAYGGVAAIQVASPAYDKANRGVSDRWVSPSGSGGDEIHWTYAATRGTTAPYKVTTTAPDTSYTEQYILDEPNPSDVWRPYGFGDEKTGRSYEDRVYDSSSSHNLLQRKLTAYEATEVATGVNIPYSNLFATRDMRPTKTVSIIFEPGNSNALATMNETVYDTAGNSDPAYFSSLNAKQSKTYHYVVVSASIATSATISTAAGWFSGSNLATTTEVDYLYDPNYKARNINGLVTETRVKDATGNVKAKSQVFYDEAAYPMLGDVSSTRWEDPNSNYRGMVTTTRSWSDITNNLYVESHAQYDRLGNLRKSWDGKGNLSQIEYSSAYDHAYPTKTISPIPGGNGSTTAFETTVVYDYSTGLPTSTTDANGQTSTMEYNDPLLRPTKVIAPNGHQTITEYGAGTSASTRFVKVSSQIDATNWKQAYSWFDGLGRTIKSQSVDSSGDVFVESQFDTFGRPWKTSNPYRVTETPVWTTNTFDTAGRPWKVTTPDNAVVTTTYDVATSGSQLGTVVTVTDQAGKLRRSVTNALGQLKRVDEANSSNQLGTVASPNQPTNYSYDILNNLTTVSQIGTSTQQCGGTITTCSQTRTFVYDSLSRLKQANNPESGVINYLYDNNSNLTSKTDARNVVTNYIYDALNRVTQRNYTAPGGLANYQATPNVTYTYDNLPNAKGKLIKVTNGAGTNTSTTEYVTFDILGRVTRSKQTTDGVVYGTDAAPMTYTYNLSGAMIEQKYPSGRVVKNVLDNDGDLSIVQSKKNANAGFFNYAKNFTYTSAGAVSSMQLGNNRWESTQFNSRLQPTQIALGTVQNGTDKLKLDYSYGGITNNGNVQSQTITVPTVGSNAGFTATQTYTYDSLNRIKDAKEMIGTTQTWMQTFLYDRYGNRNFDTTLNRTTTIPVGCAVAVCNPSVNPATNKLVGYVFDNAGNTTKDANLRKFTYDGENKQVKVETTNSGGTVIATNGEYWYDGDGKRIKKKGYTNNVLTEETIFVYDAVGKMVAEYSTVVEPASTAQISYLTNDHLGSPRITTNATGQVISRRDFLPFGEEISRANYGTDTVRQKFTTYERDGETNLDFAQARMYGNSLGRFTSPDPTLLSVNAYNPQSWNRYTYVLNNPYLYTDPLGLWEIYYQDRTKTKKNKDGTETQVFDRREVFVRKTKDGDNGASLAKQLGLTGKDAAKFAEKIGSGDNIQLSKHGGDVGRVFGAVENGLTDQKKFEDKNPGKPGEGPRSADCSETACKIAYPQQFFAVLTFSVQEADQTITANNSKSVQESNLRIADIVRFAKNGNPTHFATFIFRNDSGDPEVFSKSGARGQFERATTNDPRWSRYGYGSITGIKKTDTGYYRP